MQKICINEDDNMVNQIFNLDDYPSFDPNNYPYCYVVDDENHMIKHYGFKYNKELEIFKEVAGYVEQETIIISPSEEIEKKNKELLNLKIAIADISEEKNNEILKLKLAIVELVEGVL